MLPKDVWQLEKMAVLSMKAPRSLRRGIQTQNLQPSKQLHLAVLTMQLLIRLCAALLLDILADDFFIPPALLDPLDPSSRIEFGIQHEGKAYRVDYIRGFSRMTDPLDGEMVCTLHLEELEEI
jgi:hypothetical protein